MLAKLISLEIWAYYLFETLISRYCIYNQIIISTQPGCYSAQSFVPKFPCLMANCEFWLVDAAMSLLSIFWAVIAFQVCQRLISQLLNTPGIFSSMRIQIKDIFLKETCQQDLCWMNKKENFQQPKHHFFLNEWINQWINIMFLATLHVEWNIIKQKSNI